MAARRGCGFCQLPWYAVPHWTCTLSTKAWNTTTLCCMHRCALFCGKSLAWLAVQWCMKKHTGFRTFNGPWQVPASDAPWLASSFQQPGPFQVLTGRLCFCFWSFWSQIEFLTRTLKVHQGIKALNLVCGYWHVGTALVCLHASYPPFQANKNEKDYDTCNQHANAFILFGHCNITYSMCLALKNGSVNRRPCPGFGKSCTRWQRKK